MNSDRSLLQLFMFHANWLILMGCHPICMEVGSNSYVACWEKKLFRTTNYFDVSIFRENSKFDGIWICHCIHCNDMCNGCDLKIEKNRRKMKERKKQNKKDEGNLIESESNKSFKLMLIARVARFKRQTDNWWLHLSCKSDDYHKYRWFTYSVSNPIIQ